MSSVNKKSKYTFGGYKEVAQYGISDLANVDYYNKLAQGSQIQPLQPRGYTPPTPQNIVPIKDMPVIQPLTEPIEQQDNNMGFVDKVTGAVETGMQAYQTFIEGKRKLANQINNGIAIAAGVANLFDEAQLRRDENQKRIESLQSAPAVNSNRGLNNIPAYTKYGGSSKYNVEAEQGEVYDNNGDILKIDDNAPTHESGGVMIKADRVLENTSSMRKDPMSKSLKLSKEQVSLMSGFEAKRSMSHSDAYEFEAKKNSELQEKFLKAISKVVADPVADKYAIESAKLNADLGLAQLPSENEIFDKYFNHQEQVKEDMGYYDGKLKAKYGKAQNGFGDKKPSKYLGRTKEEHDSYINSLKNAIANSKDPTEKAEWQHIYDSVLPYGDTTDINPYRKGKQKTPTGLNSNFPGSNEDWQAYKGIWQDNLGKTYTDDYGGVYDLQMDSYNWALENDPQSIRNMWQTYGLNNKARQNNINYDVNNLTDDQLKALGVQYADGLSGARMLQPSFNNNRTPTIEPIQPRPISNTPNLPLPKVATPPLVAQPQIEPQVQQPVNQTTTPEEFNQPLEWYDTIGPSAAILSALRRDPELYNPVNIAQVRLQQQDVRPALSQNQAEYNAATQNLGNSSIAAAQRAQLFTNKLRADNQIIGQYENANRQIQNQETQYNANARDRQEAANAQSRQNFYDRVLQGRAKQTEQLLTGIDALAKTFAENRAFNRNANLIMKFAPNFDAKGNYNGVPVQFASNSTNQPGFATNNGQPVVNEKGQYLLRTTTSKDGKVTEQWVDKAYYDAQVKNAFPQRLQTQMILDSMRGGRSRK